MVVNTEGLEDLEAPRVSQEDLEAVAEAEVACPMLDRTRFNAGHYSDGSPA